MSNTAALTSRLLVGAALALTAAFASAQPVHRVADGGPLMLQVRHVPHHHAHQPPPPPPRHESRPRFRKGHVWVGGHWRWQGHRHVWIPGYWAKAPRGHHHRPHHGHR